MQYCNTTTIAYGPTILKQIGFSSNMSLLFTSIPSLIGLISTFLSIRLAKRIPYYLMITGNFLILLVSFAVVGFVKNATLKYIFFCVAGLSGTPNSSLIVTWSSLNVGGTSKRLITSALVVAVGSAGSMVSPLFFTRNYAPAFTIGFILMIVLPAVGIVLSLSIALYYKTTNDRRDRNPIDVSHLTEDEQVQLNDRHPSFRYKL
ncbi:putative transporter [Zancudomyces culisetae]|uniref:Putative transporter n=1 Tax=Zancudomyces culisetae TaxID=1213189 RepID=A0A1R1PKK0_ZANCU|nr:putative transporter [Zancudomyces culisetae]|eukprot:OMH81485.1 putative transporter [Zancudomyces culisetae]